MSYNEFMTKFKNAESGYSKKANTTNKDAKTGSGEGKDLSNGPIKGTGTPSIGKFTKEHLSNVKGKSSVKSAGKKK